jgi:hypothetical protein
MPQPETEDRGLSSIPRRCPPAPIPTSGEVGKVDPQAALATMPLGRGARARIRRPTTRSHLPRKASSAARRLPNPGACRSFTIVEPYGYENAVRDLLRRSARLPKEMDYSLLLPSDNVGSGFDKHRGSAVCLADRRWSATWAARKSISRQPGDPTVFPGEYPPLHPEQWQGRAVEDLRSAPRGGLSVRNFAAGRRLHLKVDVAGARATRTRSRLPLTTNAVHRPRRGTPAMFERRAGAAAGAAQAPRFRIPIKGPDGSWCHVHRAHAGATKRRCRSRGCGEAGTQPALASVTISGPYNATGPGDTPSRRRILSAVVGGAVRRDRQRSDGRRDRLAPPDSLSARWCVGYRRPPPMDVQRCDAVPRRGGRRADSIGASSGRSSGCS